MSNTRIWDALSKTDPKHTKPFKRSGGFQGTAIKPIWLTKRLTAHFGPAGTGWGMSEPSFQVVPAGEEILVFCTVALWYEDTSHVVYGVGGDKVMGKNKYGAFTNDEAFKASYTDALSNAMKQIGVGADIHMGLFEDEKYVRETAREFANSNTPSVDGPGSSWGPGGKEAAIDDARRDGLMDKAPKLKPVMLQWLQGAKGTLQLSGQTADSIGQFWMSCTKKRAQIEETDPDAYKELEAVYRSALDAAQARMPSNTLMAG